MFSLLGQKFYFRIVRTFLWNVVKLPDYTPHFPEYKNLRSVISLRCRKLLIGRIKSTSFVWEERKISTFISITFISTFKSIFSACSILNMRDSSELAFNVSRGRFDYGSNLWCSDRCPGTTPSCIRSNVGSQSCAPSSYWLASGWLPSQSPASSCTLLAPSASSMRESKYKFSPTAVHAGFVVDKVSALCITSSSLSRMSSGAGTTGSLEA